MTTTIFSLGYLFTVAYYHYKVLKWISFSILCSYWEGHVLDNSLKRFLKKAFILPLKITRQLVFGNKELQLKSLRAGISLLDKELVTLFSSINRFLPNIKNIPLV